MVAEPEAELRGLRLASLEACISLEAHVRAPDVAPRTAALEFGGRGHQLLAGKSPCTERRFTMGRGDTKTKRGKIFQGSFGKWRMKKKNKKSGTKKKK